MFPSRPWCVAAWAAVRLSTNQKPVLVHCDQSEVPLASLSRGLGSLDQSRHASSIAARSRDQDFSRPKTASGDLAARHSHLQLKAASGDLAAKHSPRQAHSQVQHKSERSPKLATHKMSSVHSTSFLRATSSDLEGHLHKYLGKKDNGALRRFVNILNKIKSFIFPPALELTN